MICFLRDLWAPLSPFVVAIFVLWANSVFQRRVSRRLRDADEVKRRLYELLGLASQYWTAGDGARDARVSLEARIVALSLIVLSECEQLAARTRKLKSWHEDTREDRVEFMDAVTGGRFQQSEWLPEPERVNRTAGAIERMVRTLHDAC